jgi:hypothetical protein
VATNPVSMLTDLPTSNIEQQVTSTFQETVFASSSCCETVVTPNTQADMSQSTVTSHRSDVLNPVRNTGTFCQNSSRHCISLAGKEPALEQIQHNMKHTLQSSELIFEQGCDIHHKVSSDSVTNKILHNNFRSVSSFTDASVHYGLESLNKEDPCEVTNTADLAANTSANTNELAVSSDLNQHLTSLKCIKESTFHTATGNLTTQYSSNNDTGKTSISASSDTDNILSCAGSLAHSRRLWNFGCNRKKSDVICDTVDAWSNSRSGKLFLNLKQSLFGHMNRTERMLLIGGSKPLVFGGTYPIDVPLERYVEETVNKSDKHVSPQTFDIDSPCVGFVEQMLSSASVDSQNTVLRRNKTVSQKCTALSLSPE